jgi:hypothetical protein
MMISAVKEDFPFLIDLTFPERGVLYTLPFTARDGGWGCLVTLTWPTGRCNQSLECPIQLLSLTETCQAAFSADCSHVGSDRGGCNRNIVGSVAPQSAIRNRV